MFIDAMTVNLIQYAIGFSAGFGITVTGFWFNF